jgi:hypothetical protein
VETSCGKKRNKQHQPTYHTMMDGVTTYVRCRQCGETEVYTEVVCTKSTS